jgi:hypothetical protein
MAECKIAETAKRSLVLFAISDYVGLRQWEHENFMAICMIQGIVLCPGCLCPSTVLCGSAPVSFIAAVKMPPTTERTHAECTQTGTYRGGI